MNLLASLPTVIGTAAVAPALLVLWLVIATDERPGPPLRVWGAFVLGAASISLLALARAPFAAMVGTPVDPSANLALHAVFGVAAPEETVKIIAIVVISSWRRRSEDPMDTVVYGAAAGLGFAAYENLAYLVHYPEMWRSLAILRSILTVPFHGALGIVAGAYLAIARSGTALGAHRRDRDWSRIRNRLSIFLVPVALHSGFDFPLLVLQQTPDLSGHASLLLESASMLIGFGTIGFAARLVWRVGAHHAPRTELSRERLRNLRSMWALLIAGCGAGFAGMAFVLSSIRRWIANPETTISAGLVPLGLMAIVLGGALLVISTVVYVQGRNRVQTTAANVASVSNRPQGPK